MKTDQERAVSLAVIALMKGVVYRESHEEAWSTLEHRSAPVRDHFATIGVDVVIDDTEGYAYLRSAPDNDEEPLPRLVQRRSLSFPVSLLLVILRQRLAEFEATSGEARLMLTRDQILDSMRMFLPDSTNEARLIDQVDTAIRKAHQLSFLRPLRGQEGVWEVRRIVKAFVDAQTLSDFDAKLREYAGRDAGHPDTQLETQPETQPETQDEDGGDVDE